MPSIQRATVQIVGHTNLAITGLPALLTRIDEWYNFRSNPSRHAHVLATSDEHTDKGGDMEPDHPIAWCHESLGGRALYVALGHTIASYHEPLFLRHLRSALEDIIARGPGRARAGVA